MILLASIGGIQDFLFDVREEGGGQARSLRYRSFRIQLLTECVAIRLLEAAGVSRDRLHFCAAAKVAIDATDVSSGARDTVQATIADLEARLLMETHGRLRLACALVESCGTLAEAMQRAERALRLSKFRAFAPCGANDAWSDASLTLDEPYDADREAELDAAMGRDLAGANWLTFDREEGECDDAASACLGLRVRLDQDAPKPRATIVSCSNLSSPESPPTGLPGTLFHPRAVARHIPRDAHGNPIEFVELAQRSRGAPMLGVLKADADSLGVAVSKTIASGGASSLRKFSNGLDGFFSRTLEAEKRSGDPRWASVYTIFSGGDDILAVGPWDFMVDFAGHMQSLFNREFGARAAHPPSPIPLTLSAAVAIIKPRYPVHIAVHQVEESLLLAKTRCAAGASTPKDQFAAFGDLWKWNDHAAIVREGKQLSDWVDAGSVRRGWLQTILELTLLRRGEAGSQYKDIHPAAATAKLAYHITRNWPRNGPSREWIDQVSRDFDSDSMSPHVSTIVRYALLATRGKNPGDEQ